MPYALFPRVQDKLDFLEKEGVLEKVDRSEFATLVLNSSRILLPITYPSPTQNTISPIPTLYLSKEVKKIRRPRQAGRVQVLGKRGDQLELTQESDNAQTSYYVESAQSGLRCKSGIRHRR